MSKTKSTDKFKETIQNYLETKAKEDILFEPKYKKENKNIDDCIKYILNTVKKSGCNGFTDDEIFAMTIHYYEEDNIDMNGMEDLKSIGVVVNHKIELTEEELEEARKQAKEKAVNEAYNKMKGLNKSKKTNKSVIAKQEEKKEVQQSLF